VYVRVCACVQTPVTEKMQATVAATAAAAGRNSQMSARYYIYYVKWL